VHTICKNCVWLAVALFGTSAELVTPVSKNVYSENNCGEEYNASDSTAYCRSNDGGAAPEMKLIDTMVEE
jgi:hypothetical protein